MTLAAGEFDLERTVTSGQVFLWRKEDGVWIGRDGPSVFQVTEPREGVFEIASSVDEHAFRSYFSLDVPFADVAEKVVRACPELGPIVEELRGLRLCQPQYAEETLFSFLCTANNHLSRITGMIRTLQGYGSLSFPKAEFIAAIPESELRARGFGYRAKTVTEAAKFLVERGPGWLENIKEGLYEPAFNELRQIPGIGPKLADCICLYGLHFGEAVPVDTHLWQAACRHFFPDFAAGSLTETRYREIGSLFRARFGNLAGWAQLFFYYENLVNGRARRAEGRKQP